PMLPGRTERPGGRAAIRLRRGSTAIACAVAARRLRHRSSTDSAHPHASSSGPRVSMALTGLAVRSAEALYRRPDRKVATMLSQDDSRRLAQLERQLRRDDP